MTAVEVWNYLISSVRSVKPSTSYKFHGYHVDTDTERNEQGQMVTRTQRVTDFEIYLEIDSLLAVRRMYIDPPSCAYPEELAKNDGLPWTFQTLLDAHTRVNIDEGSEFVMKKIKAKANVITWSDGEIQNAFAGAIKAGTFHHQVDVTKPMQYDIASITLRQCRIDPPSSYNCLLRGLYSAVLCIPRVFYMACLSSEKCHKSSSINVEYGVIDSLETLVRLNSAAITKAVHERRSCTIHASTTTTLAEKHMQMNVIQSAPMTSPPIACPPVSSYVPDAAAMPMPN